MRRLTGLTVLRLDDNPGLADITEIEDLLDLKEISLRNTGVTDVSALNHLRALQKLDLTGIPLRDFTRHDLPKFDVLTQLTEVKISTSDLSNLIGDGGADAAAWIVCLAGLPEQCRVINGDTSAEEIYDLPGLRQLAKELHASADSRVSSAPTSAPTSASTSRRPSRRLSYIPQVTFDEINLMPTATEQTAPPRRGHARHRSTTSASSLGSSHATHSSEPRQRLDADYELHEGYLLYQRLHRQSPPDANDLKQSRLLAWLGIDVQNPGLDNPVHPEAVPRALAWFITHSDDHFNIDRALERLKELLNSPDTQSKHAAAALRRLAAGLPRIQDPELRERALDLFTVERLEQVLSRFMRRAIDHSLRRLLTDGSPACAPMPT